MKLDPRFIVDLRGKSFCTFAGLLDLAHQAGIRSIETEVIESLSNPAEQCWVVKATGRFRDEEGQDALWSAYADASPANSQMKGAYLRHAETRAVGRMLRMAVNVGMTMLEELGDETEAPAPIHRPVRAVEVSQAAAKPAPAHCSEEGCGVELTRDEIEGSKKHFGDRLLCSSHGRIYRRAMAEQRSEQPNTTPVQ